MAAPLPCQVFGWMIRRNDFAIASAEGIAVNADYDFALTISQKIVVHRGVPKVLSFQDVSNSGGIPRFPIPC